MKIRHMGILLLFNLLLTSCAIAIGNQHSYHDTIANIAATGDITVAVAAHDQRPAVVQGQSTPNYVGMQRGRFGNPFNVTTLSGKTLAEDMTTSICNSLRARGFQTVAVAVSHADTGAKVMEKLRGQNCRRLLLLFLNEWQSDTYTDTGLSYDIKIEVFDSDGNKLAEKALKGDDNLGSSSWNPPAYAKEAVPKAFKEKIEALLNDEDVRKSLR